MITQNVLTYFIGEINTLASQYEVDLKLIDVSTQKIIASEFLI